MKAAAIHLITEGRFTDDNFAVMLPQLVKELEHAARAGITAIQIREKNLSAGRLAEITRAVNAIGLPVFVNGRPDIAAAAGTAGVHLPGNSFQAADVRKYFPGLKIGISVHSKQEAAASADVDHIYFSPIFETPNKGEPVGLKMLAEVCKAAGKTPVIALGGVAFDHLNELRTAGAAGFAAIRSLNERVRCMINV